MNTLRDDEHINWECTNCHQKVFQTYNLQDRRYLPPMPWEPPAPPNGIVYNRGDNSKVPHFSE